MYDIRSAMLNIGIVFTPGKFKINLEKTWKTPGILVNLRSTDPEMCTKTHKIALYFMLIHRENTLKAIQHISYIVLYKKVTLKKNI